MMWLAAGNSEVDGHGDDSFAWKLALMRRFDKSNIGFAYDDDVARNLADQFCLILDRALAEMTRVRHSSFRSS